MSIADTPSSIAIPDAGLAGVWRVGTLQYTRRALFMVFFWMLWGDFCLSIMESVIPRLVPLQLKDAGATSVLIGALVTSIPSGMNFVMNPIISTRSDRYRSKRGRRMPFLLFRIAFLGLIAMAIASLCGFVLVHDYSTFRLWILIYTMATALYIASNLSLLPRLLPRIRYGQFCSANAMVNAVALVLAPLGCGYMLDKTGDWRYVFAWAAIWAGAGALACLALSGQWRRLGGDLNYSLP